MSSKKVFIIGCGPSGMGCAYTLAKEKSPFCLIEKDNTCGGLSTTINFSDYLFDIGGHRFISKSKEICQLWDDVMGSDMLKVKRLSRIYYKKRYFKYPLRFCNTFWNLGAVESFLSVMSYLWCKLTKPGDDNNFKGWIINHFGERLYNIFFRNYTEKVWSVACQDISADWAKQRIKGLSLRVAIKNAFFRNNRKEPKTLANEFLYPKTGPGEFYHRLKNFSLKSGGVFLFNTLVNSIKHYNNKIVKIGIKDTVSSEVKELEVDYLFSSMPLPIMLRSLDPAPPEEVLTCAANLKFRSFLVVNIILDKRDIFPDQWIYINSPQVKLGRIQNYKNWSPAMAADLNKTSLGLEYFCTEGDDLWKMNDVAMIDYALKELEYLGIASRKHLINGFVVRYDNAYPVYSLDYQNNIRIIRNYLAGFSNFQTIGRAGLFRYDNSDHALLTGIYAARNFLEKKDYDLWNLDPDKDYLEY
ncbi:MAG: NAD(P)/FAD-dependent oxidoreductase [Candidatus Omnitrophica bacterium]|jgi:protoporphyrinogen oxidase|nr:NAD(P)/FAD-dependent oxidoreductase [Candidatus Omnitrophota bacterium]